MRESLLISVEGAVSTAKVLALLSGCPCPVPKRQLSVTFSNLPEGASITMSTGTPATLSLMVSQKALGHLAYTDTTLPAPVGLTAVSDNAAILVTPFTDPSTGVVDPLSFFVGGDGSTEATGNVTFTDSDGDTIVVTVTTTVAPPPPVKTLGITFDAPIAI